MLDAGAKGFLPKDVGKSDLIFAIKKVAMGETYVSPQLYSQMIDTARKKNGKNEIGLSLDEVISKGAEFDEVTEVLKEVDNLIYSQAKFLRPAVRKSDFLNPPHLDKNNSNNVTFEDFPSSGSKYKP